MTVALLLYMEDSDHKRETLPVPLRTKENIPRLMAIGLVIAGIAGLFLYVGGWFTPRALSPAVMINTFEQANGPHPGFRRNHAKGVGVSGYFESNGEGAALSKAVVFRSGRVPVIGRFALAGGQPYQADAAHTVRSMALLFELPNGEEWRTGINNIPVFPVNSAQGFYDLLLATTPDPASGKPDPARLATFFTKYPESAKAMQLIRGYSVSGSVLI
jgi:catalase